MISPEDLRRFPNFAGISDASLKRIAANSTMMKFEAGERLFHEGNTATHMLFLLSGEVDLVFALGNGAEVVADTLVAGDPLAWSALLEPHKLTASGVGNKAGELIMIDAAALRQMCEEDESFGYTMMKGVAKTLRSRLSAMRVQAAAAVAVPGG